jgi:hypothetical protein
MMTPETAFKTTVLVIQNQDAFRGVMTDHHQKPLQKSQ